MSRLIVAIVCGLLFGAGLVMSDMVNPARVLAFLDVAGAWDPSLALVMIGALIPSSIAYLLRRRMDAPVTETTFAIPQSRNIDRPLIGGAVLFGIGWGLVGLCPGPALAALVTGLWPALVFAVAMSAGMILFRLTLDR
ncbi:MAG: YeeE/YedE family protein [Caulobacterales bacterium]|nr:YeeE/YedE family protein [Caulobacterales bacterium]